MRGQGERKRKEEKPVGERLVGVVAAVGNCMKSHWPFWGAGAESLLWLLSWDALMCVCVHAHVCSCSVAQLCQLFSTPQTVCSPPGSSVHGILQGRILEWVSMASCGGSSHPGIELAYLALAGRFLTTSATWEAPIRRSLRLDEDIKEEPWNDWPGTLIRKERDSSEFALCQVRTQEKVAIYTPGEGSHQEPWSWTSHRTMGSKCLQQLEQAKTMTYLVRKVFKYCKGDKHFTQFWFSLEGSNFIFGNKYLQLLCLTGSPRSFSRCLPNDHSLWVFFFN